MADISNIISVALIPEGAAVQRDNINLCALMTSETGVLSTAKRYATFKSFDAVKSAFKSDTKAYQFAKTFFAQTPNSADVGGSLTIGFWRAASEVVAATSGALTGIQVSEAVTVASMQGISDGSFNVTVDGVVETPSGIDFRTVSSLNDILVILNANLTGAVATLEDGRFIVTSSTTGVLSLMTFLSENASGTFIGDILALSDGSGASIVAGAASVTLTAESKEDSLNALRSSVNFKGFVFIDTPTDSERETLASWAMASDAIGYEVFSASSNLEKNVTNPVWKIKLASQSKYRMLYSPTSQRRLAVAYMARNHVVLFTGENTALTMNLKALSDVVAEDFTQTDIDKATQVGLDIYTTIKDLPVVLCSGANDFVDNVYNLMAFINAVKVDIYNTLKTPGTKLAQTKKDVDVLEDTVEKSSRGFVRAGVFAAGTWTSPDRFGAQEVFDRAITKNGFYVLAGELSDQSTAGRQARKSPVIQVAVKNAGAIHSANIIINFNY